MQKIYSAVLFVIVMGWGINVKAQQKLTLKEAVQIALQNSYDIKLVENTVAITKNNNDYGVAGALPNVTITGSENKTTSTLQQQFADPSKNTIKSGVSGTTTGAGISASVLLFNGYRVQSTKSRLAALENQSNSLLKSQIQNTAATVMQQYYNIIRQQAYLGTIQKSIDASQQRLDIVKAKQNIGVANEADLLQSTLDLNTLLQAKENQLLIIVQAKADLLNTLVLPSNTEIFVSDSIIVDRSLSMNDIEAKSIANPSLESIAQQIKINQLIEKETRALMYPTLRASAGYSYNSNASAAGFSLLNETYGPAVSVNLSVPIYTGGASKKSYKNARINTTSANIQYQNAVADMSTNVVKTFKSYHTSIQQFKTEEENYKMSQSLLNLIMQKFQLGQATIVDVKQAQQSFESAGFRLVSLIYTAKVAEVELKRLSNQLSF